MEEYYVVLVTRLRRKVFAARNVRDTTRDALSVAAETLQLELHDTKFLDEGVVCRISAEDDLGIDKRVAKMRLLTSANIRKEYAELWKMPSFWTKKVLVMKEKPSKENLDAFLSTIPYR